MTNPAETEKEISTSFPSRNQVVAPDCAMDSRVNTGGKLSCGVWLLMLLCAPLSVTSRL